MMKVTKRIAVCIILYNTCTLANLPVHVHFAVVFFGLADKNRRLSRKRNLKQELPNQSCKFLITDLFSCTQMQYVANLNGTEFLMKFLSVPIIHPWFGLLIQRIGSVKGHKSVCVIK